MTTTELVRAFPAPPDAVRRALDQLRQADSMGMEPTGLRLARPWDPASCRPHLRRELWSWLDAVAAWLNHAYGWQTAHTVPACWPAHPHLVHELAVLACLRVAAGDATAPQAMEEWHRYVLPGFTHRMSERLGAGCAPGRHVDWPARTWTAEHTTPQATEQRRRLFAYDTGRLPPATQDGPRPNQGGGRATR